MLWTPWGELKVPASYMQIGINVSQKFDKVFKHELLTYFDKEVRVCQSWIHFCKIAQESYLKSIFMGVGHNINKPYKSL